LHSQVETLPFDIIRERLQEELGSERLKQFRYIDPVPLAAGSIAQVHRAQLVTGESVVIKVQRPGIAQQIETDLQLIETIALMIEKYIPELAFVKPHSLVQSLSRGLIGELDFVREAGCMTRIARNFEGDPRVIIPSVQWALTTERVLVLEELMGSSVSDRETLLRSGCDPSILAESCLEMFLKMVFIDGMFHGDLHPGNLLVMPQNAIGLLDFGMVVRLGRSTRENLGGLLSSLVQEDYETMVDYYLEMADAPPTLNVQLFNHEVANAMAPFMGLGLKQAKTGRVLWDLARVAAKHGAPMPQDLIIFVKTLASLEGVGTKLSPELNIMDICEEFADKMVQTMYSPQAIQRQVAQVGRDSANLMRHAPQLLRRLLVSSLEGQLKINVGGEDLRRFSRSIERASLRIAIGWIIGCLVLAGAIVSSVVELRNHSTAVMFYGIAAVLGLYLTGVLVGRK
jgi:ubiquinone biosynthesis protein